MSETYLDYRDMILPFMLPVRAAIDGSEVVYTRDLRAGFWTSMLGIPIIYEAHSLPGGLTGPAFFKLLVSGSGFRGVVVITDALKSLLFNRYGNLFGENSILTAPDAVDMDRFEHVSSPIVARKKLDFESNKFTAGYAGHLYEGRGIETILALAGHFPEIEFIVVGGSHGKILEKRDRASAQGLQNLRFCGFVPNADLPTYLAACDLLLMPYQKRVSLNRGGDTSKWMSPMKMFEYMATGRPIISSDLPVLREVLNEDNSVLCDPENIQMWKTAVEKIMDQPKLGEALGSQAREDVRQYTWRGRVRNVMTNIEP